MVPVESSEDTYSANVEVARLSFYANANSFWRSLGVGPTLSVENPLQRMFHNTSISVDLNHYYHSCEGGNVGYIS